jgi:hypothetical protein
LGVKAEDVYFGNLIKHGTFICHHIIDNDKDNGWYGDASFMHFYYDKASDEPIDDKHTIFVDFEHDRRKMTIAFPLRIPEENEKNGKSTGSKVDSSVPGVAKLVVGYNQIRRIFCDVSFYRT